MQRDTHEANSVRVREDTQEMCHRAVGHPFADEAEVLRCGNAKEPDKIGMVE